MISNNKEFINSLATLIGFKSKLGKQEDGAPFGIEVRKALDYVLSLAKDMGFETVNYDGYFGEVIVGDGEEFGIIGHLDVVPEGTGWNTEPYLLTVKNGVYYGRGITDDKAPMLMCLYALKELKEKGVTFHKKIRLMFGCNEESGWGCVDYFKKKSHFPKYGFSPDSDFPVVYAEKGINQLTVTVPYKSRIIKNLTGGTVFNAVPDYASVDYFGNDDYEKFGLKREKEKLVAKGKASHGSRPQDGINAIKKVIEYLAEKDDKLKEVLDVLFYDSLGITKIENDVGKVTLSPDIVSQDENGITFLCDLRIPYGYNVENVDTLLKKSHLNYEIEVKRTPLCVDKNGFLAKTLLNAYNEVTGENATPISLGGVTFASVFEQGMAFGPEFYGEEFHIHEPNECMSVDVMNKAFEIYYKAIKKIVE